MTPLILASSSPYRRELLARLQIPFVWKAPDIDETPGKEEHPQETCLRLSLEKARAIGRFHHQGLIIGSDQVAERNGQAISKPIDHEAAVEQLTWASGRALQFHTGLCVLDAASGHHESLRVTVTVHYRTLTPTQIERYLRKDQPYDCAGSGRIETLGITLVEKVISEDPTALIGLPLIALTSLLARFGIVLP
ncbi:MAG: septum formation protein Maf [Ferrovum myxofaciens]|uniref:7-methyl-GTP pyrophosphatase n=1 Tax=Ferrovum myxofaciens TaxID=416213 RepID=A0A149W1G8_9PROT|nr:Maf family nucleotide pyrophosphatase [Ferrovum myxofaciens]KXW59288.1 Maf-like protein YceF [Ferrovum myxofaciens]QKE40135.1 MAG: septum formation protein Maf [Ferrovum myxofaciens]